MESKPLDLDLALESKPLDLDLALESKPLDLDLALESKPLDLDFSGFLVPTRRRGNPFGTRQRPVFAERDAGA